MKKGNKKKDIERFEALRDAAAQIADGNFDIKKYYGITDDGLEAIYNIGYEMYNHKKYENAGDVFNLLTMLEPNSTKYLSACASAQYMAGNYDRNTICLYDSRYACKRSRLFQYRYKRSYTVYNGCRQR